MGDLCCGMQVGEPGLGKELFTKNIFAPYCADNDLPVNSCEPDTEPSTFQHNPAEFCTEIVVDVDDGRTKIHYLIQVHLPMFGFGISSPFRHHV